MKESNIILEAGDYWVCDLDNQYTVYKNTITHAQADSSYPLNKDGLSLAKARCMYLYNQHLRNTIGKNRFCIKR